jgi:ornithine cyclodeaminase/alanine dehydrogenase-like protein (mu-crystallin family)
VLDAHAVAAAIQAAGPALRTVVLAALAADMDTAAPAPPASTRWLTRNTGQLRASTQVLTTPEVMAGLRWSARTHGAAGAPRPRSATVLLLDEPLGAGLTVMDGALIGAQRAAITAAFALEALHRRQPDDASAATASLGTVGLSGCGLLGAETLRWLLAGNRPVDRLVLHDVSKGHASALAGALRQGGLQAEVVLATDRATLVQACDALILAASMRKPWLSGPAASGRCRTMVHLSLAELGPQILRAAQHWADDPGAACEALPGLALGASGASGGQLPQPLARALSPLRAPAKAHRQDDSLQVVHLAGHLGADLAMARWVVAWCRAQGTAKTVAEFLP